MHLRAIGAGIEPVLLRIAGDAVGAGADVAAAVLLVPDRRGEFGDVDVVAHHDVLEHRAVLDDLVRDDLRILQIGFAIGVAQLPFGEMVGEAERHVAAHAGEHVEQQPEALGRARHLVEHHAGAVLGAQDRLRDQPDVLLPGRALEVLHLAEPLGGAEPLAQVVIGDVGFDVASVGHSSFSTVCSIIASWPGLSRPPGADAKSTPRAGEVLRMYKDLREFIAEVEKLGALRRMSWMPTRISSSAASPRSRRGCRNARRCCSTASRAIRRASASSPTPPPIRSAPRWRSGSIPTLRPLDALKAWMAKRQTLKTHKPVTVKDARVPGEQRQRRRRRPCASCRRRCGTPRTAGPISARARSSSCAIPRRGWINASIYRVQVHTQEQGHRAVRPSGPARRDHRQEILGRGQVLPAGDRQRHGPGAVHRRASNICRRASRNTNSPARSRTRRSR